MDGFDAIFKAYDIRGVVPDELDGSAARRIGWGFVRYLELERIVVGRDMRVSSTELVDSFVSGANQAGASVVDIGEVSTDALYYASGVLELPGAMFTASHNPARYNGLKLCRARAAPIGGDSGLEAIKELARQAPDRSGSVEERREITELLPDYAAHCRSLIDPELLKPLKVAVDAGNGMAGKTVPLAFEPLPLEVVPLYFELDGTFPNHPANPIEPANLVALQAAVREGDCDLGIAFDGDADRMFLVDETGELVDGSSTTALVSKRLLERFPGETVLYNLICSRSVPEVIAENGGKPVRTRVGHSFIKEIMAQTGAIFGGEHSGHYYFRDNFRADSGLIAALIVFEALSLDGRTLSAMLEEFHRYAASGEINSEVEDQAATLERLADAFPDGRQDRSDGLTVEFDEWWFNCRPSNTEPLLRLNLEAADEAMMTSRRDEVLAIIRNG